MRLIVSYCCYLAGKVVWSAQVFTHLPIVSANYCSIEYCRIHFPSILFQIDQSTGRSEIMLSPSALWYGDHKEWHIYALVI